eukprot:5627340-Amphidinium_carterae.1
MMVFYIRPSRLGLFLPLPAKPAHSKGGGSSLACSCWTLLERVRLSAPALKASCSLARKNNNKQTTTDRQQRQRQ